MGALLGLKFFVIPIYGGIVCPRNIGVMATSKGFIKQRMGQKVLSIMRKGTRTGCPKITTGVLISA